MPVLRSDESSIIVFLNGAKLPGEWAVFSGADVTSAGVKTREDGREVALGGLPEIGDLTVTRNYDPLRDNYKAYADAAGNTPVQVVTQTRDSERAPIDTPISYSGILLNVTRSDVDQRASSGNREITLVAQIDTIA